MVLCCISIIVWGTYRGGKCSTRQFWYYFLQNILLMTSFIQDVLENVRKQIKQSIQIKAHKSRFIQPNAEEGMI